MMLQVNSEREGKEREGEWGSAFALNAIYANSLVALYALSSAGDTWQSAKCVDRHATPPPPAVDPVPTPGPAGLAHLTRWPH